MFALAEFFCPENLSSVIASFSLNTAMPPMQARVQWPADRSVKGRAMRRSDGHHCCMCRMPRPLAREAYLENLHLTRPTVFSNAWPTLQDRKSTRLNSSHLGISYAVFC